MKRTDNAVVPPDPATIDPDDERAMFYWSRHLRVGPSVLRAIVKRVGSNAENVRAEAARMRQRGDL